MSLRSTYPLGDVVLPALVQHDTGTPRPVGESGWVSLDGALQGDAVAQGSADQLVWDAHHGRDCGERTRQMAMTGFNKGVKHRLRYT